MVQHEPSLKTSIKNAEDLIENNKRQGKEDGAQQLQKLRYNTADLKVRFESVSTQYIHIIFTSRSILLGKNVIKCYAPFLLSKFLNIMEPFRLLS